MRFIDKFMLKDNFFYGILILPIKKRIGSLYSLLILSTSA